MNILEWKDITSYSQNEKERVPRVWECRAGVLRLAICSRHIHYPPGVWVGDCQPLFDQTELKATDLEAAKVELLELTKSFLECAIKSVKS